MKSNTLTISLLFIASLALIFQSCVKTPTPSFTWEPVVNPEAGDTIFFLNSSLDATTYEWDFGDTYTSTDVDPTNIYVKAGSYDVKLTASNQKKSEMLTQTIVINEPTVLGMWVYEDDTATVVADVSVWVYDNESDWQNVNDPQFQGFTDSDGFAMFLNLEAQTYIVDLYKEAPGGFWGAAYGIPALELNKVALYDLPMLFTETTQKAAGRKTMSREKPLPLPQTEKQSP